MLKTICPTAAAILLLAGAPVNAQSTTLFNGGFEIADSEFGATSPEGWFFLNFQNDPVGDDDPTDDFIRRRVLDDGQMPFPGQGGTQVPVRSGSASLMISGGEGTNFRGVLNSNGSNDLGGIDRRLSYTPFGQEVRITGWYNIPQATAWQIQQPGFKIEFRESDGGNFRPTNGATVGPEFFLVNSVLQGGTGHNGGVWEEFELNIDNWYIEQFILRYSETNDGLPSQGSEPPAIFFLLPFIFGGQSNDPLAPDFLGNETGAVFFDDLAYTAELGNTSPTPNRRFYGDRQHYLEVALDGAAAGAPVPVTMNANNPDSPPLGTAQFPFWASAFFDTFQIAWDFDNDGFGNESWTSVLVYDRVPGWDEDATGEFQFQTGWYGYPLTWTDNIVDSRLFGRVQSDDGGVTNLVNQNGSTGSAGSSAVTTPSYQSSGLRRADIGSADVITTYQGLEQRSPTRVVAEGTYQGSLGTITATRDYSEDSAVGRSVASFSYEYTADAAISLDGEFRLGGLESFYTAGSYLADRVMIGREGDANANFDEATPGADLFASPVAFAVGDTIILSSNPGATPADAPTVSLTLDSLVGATTVGVQGTVDVAGNVEVWIEWTDAPATVSGGTGIAASFTVSATDPCIADFNGDGVLDVRDYLAVQNLADGGDTATDFDDSTSVNGADLVAYDAEFGNGCN